MALSQAQIGVARQIIAEGKRRGVPRHVIRVALGTSLVESNLTNIHGGDRDSLGAFQQRPSMGWGSPQQVLNVRYAAGKFFDSALPLYQKGMRGGQLAQAVQRSAFPGRYAPRVKEAGSILSGLGGDIAGGGAATAASAGAGGQVVTKPGIPTMLPPAPLTPLLAQPSKFIGGELQPAPPPLASSSPSSQETLPGQPTLAVDKGAAAAAGAQQATMGGSTGQVTVAPGANRPGAPLQKAVLNFARAVSAQYGKPLTIGTGTNHNQFVIGTTRQSDHWTGHGADIPSSGAALTRLGQAALIAAGMPRRQALRQRGGLFNINGHQVIFNSMIGGNHYNHLHISA